MKNKILLLLVLLIPGLCFGGSVMLRVSDDKKTIKIQYTSSMMKNGLCIEGQFTFETQNGVIQLKSNIEEKKNFLGFCLLFLSKQETKMELFKFFNTEIQDVHFNVNLERWMIKEGYSLTFKKEQYLIGDNIISEFFFYKPDK